MKEKYPIEALLALREQGLSYREIGRKTGPEHRFNAGIII